MTKQNEINYEENLAYVPLLDHGFVGLVDFMGSDSSVVQAARVSYGEGTKAVSTDRNLIRYLMRHHHWTPFEMCEVKFHIKIPIFIMRQLVRHRTASINEYSGRYSVMSDEFYTPEYHVIKPQSQTNKQGREGTIHPNDIDTINGLLEYHNEQSNWLYNILLGDGSFDDGGAFERREENEFTGISRELARIVLPVSNYTELYWKANLRNFLHMAKLRMDSHAQYEIRELATEMYNMVKQQFPLVCEAWEDYEFNARTFSDKEIKLIKRYLSFPRSIHMNVYAEQLGLGERELSEFYTKLQL